jgi:ribosome-binding ATPase
MKVAILGQPQAGQVQLFTLLTAVSPETIGQKPLEAHPGVCAVRDPRLNVLATMYSPEKVVPAKIEFLLLPDFILEGPAKTVIMKGLRDADAICWVSRDENAEAEVGAFFSELVIADLILVETRLENIAKALKKKPTSALEKELKLIETCRDHLEKEMPLARIPFTDEQRKDLSSYQFLTLIPIIVALNVQEDHLSDDTVSARVRNRFPLPCIQLCVTLEEEISRLEEKERGEFMAAMGIAEPALDRMTRLIFDSLGYISFFTVGDDEVRAWPLRKGSSALEAAGAIHSDLARGFIRAEMMTYNDLAAAGTERVLKEQGKIYLKGKEYVVEDGDILSIRFSV